MNNDDKKYHNTEDELTKLFSFIKETWIFPDHFSNNDIFKFIEKPFNAGILLGKELFQADKFVEKIEKELLDKHTSFLNKEYAHIVYYDGFNHLINNIIAGSYLIQKDKEQSIDCEANYIIQTNIATSFLNGKKVEPKLFFQDKSYLDILEIFESDDVFDQIEKEEDTKQILFHGLNTKTFDFKSRTSLRFVLENNFRQKRTSLSSLIIAIIHQAMDIAEHNNLVESIELIKLFNLPTDFQFKLTECPNSPYLMDCVKAINRPFFPITKDFADQIKTNQEKYEALSDSEKKLFNLKTKKSLKNNLKDILDI